MYATFKTITLEKINLEGILQPGFGDKNIATSLSKIK